MRQETLSAIEYWSVLEWLSEVTQSEPGSAAALSLSPTLSPQESMANWDLVGQARAALDISEGPDLRDHLDLSPILSTLGPEGARLDIAELKLVGLEAKTSSAASGWLASFLESSPALAVIAGKLAPFHELMKSLDLSLGPEGEILDSASPRLASLRQEMSSARAALSLRLSELIRSEEYKPLLMDELVTTRNGRFVIPVRASATGKKRGLVHDWSNSGATAYLEPMETVDDNNRLALLQKEEKREIDRILTRLSSACRENSHCLALAGEALTLLDLTLAEAKLARLWRAWPPAWAPGQGIMLTGAKHPLLERRLASQGRHMIPLDIAIDPRKPLMVISGVNTGGKTVALKTLGLVVALSRAGLVPPVGEGSYLDFPSEMVTVMGDSQDLDSDLSTFSGHVKALGEALDIAGPGVLALVDELGSGTDPAEGAALGLAALERLLSSGALVIAATHFHLIKSWAALTEGVVSVSVKTGSSGQPSYGLSYGAPGFSGGLAMARRLGLPGELVDRAEGLLDSGHREAINLLRKLDEERGALAAERASLELAGRELEKVKAETATQAARLFEDYNRKAREMEAKVKSALAQNRLERETLKREIREALGQRRKVDPVATAMAFANLENALAEARPEFHQASDHEPLEAAHVGSLAYLPSLGRQGQVVDANVVRDEYRVSVGGLTFKVRLAELFKPPDDCGKPQGRHSELSYAPSPAEPSLSVNLIGMTVSEAETALEKEIDRAILSGQSRITVIHGLGTGRLRRGVIDYLRRRKDVAAFRSPSEIPGGAGVTEVDLFAG
ncbi:MAG: Smr/MutS family protein [Deltaproteobacteria bacterium]|nr:Smr/MutS family protein [Deltaproteobacteria bacterium]